jgi:hypothetical protein
MVWCRALSLNETPSCSHGRIISRRFRIYSHIITIWPSEVNGCNIAYFVHPSEYCTVPMADNILSTNPTPPKSSNPEQYRIPTLPLTSKNPAFFAGALFLGGIDQAQNGIKYRRFGKRWLESGTTDCNGCSAHAIRSPPGGIKRSPRRRLQPVSRSQYLSR